MFFVLYRYPCTSEDAIAESCPVCQKNCNCKACLRLDYQSEKVSHLSLCKAPEFWLFQLFCSIHKCSFYKMFWFLMQDVYPEFEVTKEEKVEHSKYLIHTLLPFLKRLNAEQVTEMEMEATRQGIFFLVLIRGITLVSNHLLL